MALIGADKWNEEGTDVMLTPTRVHRILYHPTHDIPTETRKARARREKEGFFEKYCQGLGIDIGAGADPLLPDMRTWDVENGDAQYMKGCEIGQYDFVYSSHCLEDLDCPAIGVFNWWRLLKPGGYLILYIPHRDLFEHRKTLPSSGNANHKSFWLIGHDEPPCTFGLVPLVEKFCEGIDIEYVKKCDDGYCYWIQGPQVIAKGEFSIELVARKALPVQYID